ncbi:MAG: SAM-dependent methyltransferase [Methanobrevibacter boviskoreani]|uniref:SAM-dependent methyltransferase n=1 Tax=Methanobrevibacter boviskoreani TaxID=1348249 RepID=UPI003D8EC90F
MVAVDLNDLELNSIPSTVTFFKGDAFSKELKEKLIENGPYNAIISDAAPKTTGNRTVDTLRSEQLAEKL